MTKYKVTIWLMLPHQDSVKNPKTKKVTFEVHAESSYLAYKEAEKLDTSLLSIWDYKVLEIPMMPGDKVIKNEAAWIPNDFDSWGRGIGIGIIVDPPFELEPGQADVRWDGGRCFENTDQLTLV